MNNDLQKEIVQMQKEQELKKQRTREFIIGLIISLVINAIIAGLMIYLNEFNEEVLTSQWLKLLSDSFAFPGLFTLLLYLLAWVSEEGAFDAISYSVQLLFVTIFQKDLKESKLPKTYADYRALKKRDDKKETKFLLVSGGIFFLIGIGFMIAFRRHHCS